MNFVPGMSPLQAIEKLNELSARSSFYGSYSTAPSTRPDGTTRQAGDRYYDTVANAEKTFNGSIWYIPSVDAAALAGPGGATTVGYVASGIGAVPNDAGKKLKQFFDAEDYGFSVNGSSEQNRTAVLNAAVAAQGREVRVNATADFLMGEVVLENMPVNLVFGGGGRVNKTAGGGVMQIRSSYTDIQNVTEIAFVTFAVDGNSSGRATRLAVADSSAYKRGDVVRVISDDIEAGADSSEPRRMGESAIVAGVGSGLIYLATALEDFGLYVTNPRVARLPQRKISLRGLRCLSSLTHTGQLLGLVALHKPYIEFEVEDHGQIAINSSGLYLGEFHVKGSGKGDSSGSLGYLVNDISGWGNRFIRPHGRYWRHVLTTNHNETTVLDSRIHLYGGCRNHTVIDGTAEACQGVPWDEHPGARRTRWENCSAFSSIRNVATAHTAFQARGRDCRIINPTVDSSFAALLRVSGEATSTVNIIGGQSACPMFDTIGSIANMVIRVTDHECSPLTAQTMFGAVDCEVHIHGGQYKFRALTTNSAQFISALPGARYFLHGPSFHVMRHPTTPGTSFRFLRTAAGTGDALIAGNCKLSSDGTATGISALFRSDNVDSRLMVRANWIKGVQPGYLQGTFATLKYAIADLVTASNSATNVTTLDDYVKTIGAF